MDITITLTDRQADGLTMITDEFNLRQGDKDNLTPDQYAANELIALANGWADQFDVATTSNVDYLRRMIQEDPAAVKAALDTANPIVQPSPVTTPPLSLLAKAKSWFGMR